MADQRADAPGTEAGGRPRTAAEDGCRHNTVTTFFGPDAEPKLRMWACADCNRRFYPACPVCVSVGHRGEDHEAAADSLRSVEPAAAEPQRFTIHRASPSDRIVPAAAEPPDLFQWTKQALLDAGWQIPLGPDGAVMIQKVASRIEDAMAAQPPRGSLTDPVREHFEEWGVHMCDSTHLAGG